MLTPCELQRELQTVVDGFCMIIIFFNRNFRSLEKFLKKFVRIQNSVQRGHSEDKLICKNKRSVKVLAYLEVSCFR